jgi:heme/copper-type cytochrome/quinol oxidase subunit 3
MSTILYEEPGSMAGELPSAPPFDTGSFFFFIGLALDAILFVTFGGCFFVLRQSAITWPPADLHLQKGLVGFSTISLLLAAVLLSITVFAQNRNALQWMRASLMMSLLFLTTFLCLNGLDWNSLFATGLPIRTIFGGLYFVLTGLFHLHIALGILYIINKYRWTLHWRHYTRSAASIARLSYFMDAMLLLWIGIYAVIYL